MSAKARRQAFVLTSKAIYRRFGPIYLIRETTESKERSVVLRYEEMGFLGYMWVRWMVCICIRRNAPLHKKGQHHNPKDGKPATISCEALRDSSSYCWHMFACRCGTTNDLMVKLRSPLFTHIWIGKRRMTPPEGFRFNVMRRHWLLYMLSDGIYRP